MRDEILNLVQNYLSQGNLFHFAEEFADLYVRVRQDRGCSSDAWKFCSAIVGPLAELSRGHRSQQSFAEELANAVRPFDFAEAIRRGISVRFAEASTR